MLRNMKSSVRLMLLALCATILLVLVSCGGGQSAQDSNSGDQGGENTSEQSSGQKYPDVKEAELESTGENTWSLSVTISSPYDSPERYADGWRVLAPDGTVLGKHELMHDHANEQPFTRTQTGLEIPQDVQEITVEGRDLKNGYGGETVTVDVPRS
ncbi:MAG: hypothetical protein ACFB50_17110 [Rubrobacteraceae bacterium]